MSGLLTLTYHTRAKPCTPTSPCPTRFPTESMSRLTHLRATVVFTSTKTEFLITIITLTSLSPNTLKADGGPVLHLKRAPGWKACGRRFRGRPRHQAFCRVAPLRARARDHRVSEASEPRRRGCEYCVAGRLLSYFCFLLCLG